MIPDFSHSYIYETTTRYALPCLEITRLSSARMIIPYVLPFTAYL
jgi:hypothetical protein